jgi:head-tail adaptor
MDLKTIGELNERITLLEPTDMARRESGFKPQRMMEWFTCWANIKWNAGGEPTAGDARQNTRSGIVTIRQGTPRMPLPKDEIQWGSRTLGITAVIPSDDRIYWIMNVREVLTQ